MTLLESAAASWFPLPAAPLMELEAHAWEGNSREEGLLPGLVEPGSSHTAAEPGTWAQLQHLGSLVGVVAFAPNSPAWWMGTAHTASQRENGWQGKEGRACKDGFLLAAVHRTWRMGACTHPEVPGRGKGRGQ